MEAKKRCLPPACSSDKERLLFEDWYRGCEQNPGLLEQMTSTEQAALRERQFLSITQNLSLQKNKLVLVVI